MKFVSRLLLVVVVTRITRPTCWPWLTNWKVSVSCSPCWRNVSGTISTPKETVLKLPSPRTITCGHVDMRINHWSVSFRALFSIFRVNWTRNSRAIGKTVQEFKWDRFKNYPISTLHRWIAEVAAEVVVAVEDSPEVAMDSAGVVREEEEETAALEDQVRFMQRALTSSIFIFVLLAACFKCKFRPSV